MRTSERAADRCQHRNAVGRKCGLPSSHTEIAVARWGEEVERAARVEPLRGLGHGGAELVGLFPAVDVNGDTTVADGQRWRLPMSSQREDGRLA
jgi:hypothetical protein